MPQPLNKLTIKGFKSIRSLVDFELTNLNVLIGGNGAGKSNFIDFFSMMRAMTGSNFPELDSASLRAYIAKGGGSDNYLFNGPNVTKQIEFEMHFGDIGFSFKLDTTDETFLSSTNAMFPGSGELWDDSGGGTPKYHTRILSNVSKCISSLKIYHFHDTSNLAGMRRPQTIDDNAYLRFDASNIAPFLLYLKENDTRTYEQIVDTIRLVALFFGDFILKPEEIKEKVRLRWQQKNSDYPLKAYHLSDGTLRFICLTTALLKIDPSSIIIIDEPELGLHPYAIEILAELIQAASTKTQLIVSTQSPALVDCFEPEDVIVVNREDGASTFQRLKADELSIWLEDYSLGDLWRKNIVEGSPVHE
ncbi:MAG: AAA family ATPase [Nitrospirae bacterium]|nr:AAA family ATPase [Nitrospirota bacterium]